MRLDGESRVRAITQEEADDIISKAKWVSTDEADSLKIGMPDGRTILMDADLRGNIKVYEYQ